MVAPGGAAMAPNEAAYLHVPYLRAPTLMPTSADLERAALGGPPLGTNHVLFAILASCQLPDRLRVADETWCGHHHAGLHCHAYVECELDTAPATTAVKVVPASEYLPSWHVPHEQCCAPVPMGSATWDGTGPSTYYCANASGYAAHAAVTLLAQFRFVPALQHLRTSLTDEVRWAVLVDDDAWVMLPRLLSVLGGYRHDVPLQLGDFIPVQPLNTTHWRRPFACGGAGTVLSRAALERTDWEGCMRQSAGTCQQSDWMIGRCLEAANVTAVVGASCGTCVAGPGFATSPHATKLRASLRERRCAFAQFSGGKSAMTTLFGAAEALTYQTYALTTPAISHWSASPLLSRPHCRHAVASGDGIGAADGTSGATAADSRGAMVGAGWPEGVRLPLLLIGAQKAAARSQQVGGLRHSDLARLLLAPRRLMGALWLANAMLAIGKAASSSLFGRVAQHPRFCASAAQKNEESWFDKEKHFFDKPERCARGVGWYGSLFAPRGSASVEGGRERKNGSGGEADWGEGGAEGACSFHVDATPLLAAEGMRGIDNLLLAPTVYYSLSPRLTPTARLVGVVREPVARTHSLWKHKLSLGEAMCDKNCNGFSCGVLSRCSRTCAPDFESGQVRCYRRSTAPTLSFREWLARRGAIVLAASAYAPQIELWRMYFGSGLLLLGFDELLFRPAQSLQALAAHAGLPPFPPSLLGPPGG